MSDNLTPVAYTSRRQLGRLAAVHGEIVEMWNKGLLRPEEEIPLYAHPPAPREDLVAEVETDTVAKMVRHLEDLAAKNELIFKRALADWQAKGRADA